MAEEREDDLAKGVKRIKGEVQKISKETALGIAAGVAVVVVGAYGRAMEGIFNALFSPKSTLAAQIGFAIFATVVAVFAGRYIKKHSEQPVANPG